MTIHSGGVSKVGSISEFQEKLDVSDEELIRAVGKDEEVLEMHNYAEEHDADELSEVVEAPEAVLEFWVHDVCEMPVSHVIIDVLEAERSTTFTCSTTRCIQLWEQFRGVICREGRRRRVGARIAEQRFVFGVFIIYRELGRSTHEPSTMHCRHPPRHGSTFDATNYDPGDFRRLSLPMTTMNEQNCTSTDTADSGWRCD